MKLSQENIMYCVVVGAIANCFVVGGAPGQMPTQESPKAQAESTKEDNRAGWVLQSKEQAIAKVREIVGLAEREAPQFTAELVTLTEDNTPFLKEQIVGRPIWSVAITDWKLQLKSVPSDVKDSYTRTFDVFVDPQGGQLLKIISRWPEGVPSVAPEPSADSAQEQMGRAGGEKYHGFPDTKPSLSFLQALDVVVKDGAGNPLIAKQIVAHYVVRSSRYHKPSPVWAITLRGIPPIRAAYPGVPVDARNHLRNIVDAQTGKWICAGTCPQPDG